MIETLRANGLQNDVKIIVVGALLMKPSPEKWVQTVGKDIADAFRLARSRVA